MKYKIISDPQNISRELWNQFLLEHKNGNFFQSAELYYFYKSLSEYEPIIIFCTDLVGNILGLLQAVITREQGFIKSHLSNRCIVHGGPVVKYDNKEVTFLLLQELVKIVQRKSIFIEFRNLFNQSDNKEVFQQNGFTYEDHYNFIIPIKTTEENFKRLKENRRRQIKKSIEKNVSIVESKDINEIKEFYSILKKLYKDKIKKPLPHLSFFEKFLVNSDMGKYFLIKFNERIIGGIMCPIFKETIYEWYKCGNFIEYKNIYPSVMATWAPIEYAVKSKLKYFDLLGAGNSKSGYGVRDFKSRFGGELINNGRFLRINNKMLYILGLFAYKLYRVLR